MLSFFQTDEEVFLCSVINSHSAAMYYVYNAFDTVSVWSGGSIGQLLFVSLRSCLRVCNVQRLTGVSKHQMSLEEPF